MSGYVPKPGDRVVVSREFEVSSVSSNDNPLLIFDGRGFVYDAHLHSFAPVVETVDVARDEVRAGDLVTLAFRGHEFTGVAWFDADNEGLQVGSVSLKWYGLHDSPVATFIRASRVKKATPPLPKVVGTYIVASGDDHGHPFTDATLVLDRDAPYVWVGFGPTGNRITVYPQAIASWSLAKVVPA